MNLFRGQKVKGQGHQVDNAHTQVWDITIFLKISLFMATKLVIISHDKQQPY